MKHLFLLTIPIVQAFIKQARKTQDLYAGMNYGEMEDETYNVSEADKKLNHQFYKK